MNNWEGPGDENVKIASSPGPSQLFNWKAHAFQFTTLKSWKGPVDKAADKKYSYHCYMRFHISYLSQNATTKKISKSIPVNVPAVC